MRCGSRNNPFVGRHHPTSLVGPSDSTPDGKPLGVQLLYLKLPAGMRRVEAVRHIFAMGYKRCLNFRNTNHTRFYLRAILTDSANTCGHPGRTNVHLSVKLRFIPG